MRVRRRSHGDHLRAGTGDRIVQISERLRHAVSIGTSLGALSIHAHETDDVESSSTHCRYVNAAAEPRANNQCRRSREVHARHSVPTESLLRRTPRGINSLGDGI